MIRILLLIVVGFLLWGLFRSISRIARGKPGSGRAAPPSTKTDDMVRCGQCGVNLPKSDARLEGGIYYCLEGESCIHRQPKG